MHALRALSSLWPPISADVRTIKAVNSSLRARGLLPKSQQRHRCFSCSPILRLVPAALAPVSKTTIVMPSRRSLSYAARPSARGRADG